MDYRRFSTLLALLPILILCISRQASAQSLSLFDIDASGFPTIRAKFWALDSNGKQVRPASNQLSLKENGIERTIFNLNCPPVAQPKPLSSVLVIDIGSSMSSGNMDLAKSAARAWVNGLPLGISECAITSFDDNNYLNQDFTTDRSKLLNAINSLQPQGGTNYDAALLYPMAGGLEVSKTAKYQKVIVFLTDGLPQQPTVTKAIASEAKQQNCVIYCISVGMPAPIALKDIARNTGGQVFENIRTVKEAEDAYKNILQIAQGISPCYMEWQGGISCGAATSSAELNWQSVSSKIDYELPDNAIVTLKVSPIFTNFGKKALNTYIDTTIVLTALNADITVLGISQKSGSSDFTVLNTTFPFTIPQNTSTEITLRYMPSDTNLQYAYFEIATDQCAGYISCKGGVQGNKTLVSTLKLTRPAKGETVIVGDDMLIAWEGVPPTDTVQLEYSTDNGINWNIITKKATRLSYKWSNIQLPGNTQGIIRILHRSRDRDSTDIPLTIFDMGTCIAFSRDGSRLAAGNRFGVIKLWDVQTGTEIPFPRTYDWINGITFSPDGSKIAIATGSFTYNAQIFDISTGQKLRTIAGHTNMVWDVTFSPDGSKIATASSDRTARIWDAQSGKLLSTLVDQLDNIVGVAFSPDGSKIVTAGGGSLAKIWDANTGIFIRTLIGHGSDVMDAAFSPDGRKVATASADNTARIWDAETGTELLKFVHPEPLWGIDYSPDGKSIATACEDGIAKIWNVNTGKLQDILIGHRSPLTDIAYSPDGNKLVTTSGQGDAKIWDIDIIPFQEYKSDTAFRIVAPQAASRDLNLGQVILGSYRDSVCMDFIQNSGSYPFQVKSISFRGFDAEAFSIISGIPPYTMAGGTNTFAELRFSPLHTGVHTAEIVIITQADTLIQKISGTGIAPVLAIVKPIIDFGIIDLDQNQDLPTVATICNIGQDTLTITNTRHDTPNAIDFSTLAGGGNFTLAPGDTAYLDLRFSPSNIGRTSGRLLFEYNGIGSPAIIQLFGQGIFRTKDTVRTTIGLDDISGNSGDTVNLKLMLLQQSGMQAPGAPTQWRARLKYNASILHAFNTSDPCTLPIDNCSMELSGSSTPGANQLISVPMQLTLGNTDQSPLVIDEFRWTNSSIVTEVITQNGLASLKDLCEQGGVRLVIPTGAKTSLVCRPNPVRDMLRIEYGLIEEQPVTIQIVDMQGRVRLIPVQINAQSAGIHTITTDISTLGAGVYYVRMIIPTGTLTNRLDIIP
jgi:WD40 repeat protein